MVNFWFENKTFIFWFPWFHSLFHFAQFRFLKNFLIDQRHTQFPYITTNCVIKFPFIAPFSLKTLKSRAWILESRQKTPRLIAFHSLNITGCLYNKLRERHKTVKVTKFAIKPKVITCYDRHSHLFSKA